MTPEQFEQKVRTLERDARERPRVYATRVMVLACLGYLYLALMLTLLVAIAALLVIGLFFARGAAILIVKGGFIVFVLLGVLVRSLWLRPQAPEGRAITADEAPALFQMLEQLRRTLGVPRFNRVLIDRHLNAGVAEWPRLGLFGWYRRDLVLGLPVMKSLTVDQFRAVLAHELGHLASRHRRLSHWVRRQRMRWSRIAEAFEARGGSGRWMIEPFLRRFAPWFAAYAFPLERLSEFESDAVSAELVSPRVAAEALTSMVVIDRFLDEHYWAEIGRRAADSPTPDAAPFRDMEARLARFVDSATAQKWVNDALRLESTHFDVHPCFRDRLNALEERPRLSLPAPGQSAAGLLGAAGPVITEEFDEEWRTSIASAWQERHAQIGAGGERLEELDARADADETLSVDEGLERALLTESIRDDAESCLEQLHQLADRAHDHAPTLFHLGSRLLARGDDHGRSLVMQAMDLDDDAIVPGAEALRDHHSRQGETQEALEWHHRAIVRSRDLAELARDEMQLQPRDSFEPHDLDPSLLAPTIAQLRSLGVHRAYLARRKPRSAADRGCLVLCFKCVRFWTIRRSKRSEQVLARIIEEVDLPEGTIIFSLDDDQTRFHRKFRKVRGARLI